MKIGKVSQTVLKRSILKQLQFQREEAMFPTSMEESCYGVRSGEDQVIATTATLYGSEKDLGVFALAQVANELAAHGAQPVGVALHILLPPYAYESRLKAMIECVERAGRAAGIQIMSARAEVSPVIHQAIVNMNGMGIVSEEKLRRNTMGKADQDLVMLKWVGLEGTLRVLREKEEELRERFVPTFLNRIRDLESEIFSVKAMELAYEAGASCIHQITAGGVLSALWDLSEASGIGVEVDLKKMPIRQETVEICEYCHLNPYHLTSAGSALIVTDRGEALVGLLEEEGICASVIGRTTKDTAKVILGGEEKRFLDRPAPDELFKIYEPCEGGTQ